MGVFVDGKRCLFWAAMGSIGRGMNSMFAVFRGLVVWIRGWKVLLGRSEGAEVGI